VVTAHFGIETIPGTKLKRKTDGIEISLPVGSVVKCVADGKISYISEVDGEQMIIIQHGKYFTGYTNLSSVSVNKNQDVKAGTVLGRSGVSIDGEGSLIFMIMNEKSTPIDPEIWLKSRSNPFFLHFPVPDHLLFVAHFYCAGKNGILVKIIFHESIYPGF
jgi:septal ring factor EnvC (AmiA/AmiB activator)